MFYSLQWKEVHDDIIIVVVAIYSSLSLSSYLSSKIWLDFCSIGVIELSENPSMM